MEFTRERVNERLRLAKGMALKQGNLTAVKNASKALATIGDDLFTEQEAQELDLLLERECVQTALYRHYDTNGILLYVGISLGAIRRQIEHKAGSHWFDRVARIDIERFPAYSAALDAERCAIKAEKPLYNVIYNACSLKPKA